MVTWSGSPSAAGLGQREGLGISGTFLPPRGWSAEKAGYRPAPWPTARETAERAFGLGKEVDRARFLRCEFAGNDVLRAQGTRPCDEAPRPVDLIVCAVDETGAVHATVRSAY